MKPMRDKRLVQALVQTIIPPDEQLDWSIIAERLGGAWEALADLMERGESIKPARDFPILVGAVIHHVRFPAVSHPDQALLYEMSEHPAHRAAGRKWLDARPEERQRVASNTVLWQLDQIVKGNSSRPRGWTPQEEENK